MRMIAFAAAAAMSLAAPAMAQEQRAGNAASANADDTFEKLVAQCDDIDALVIRARIRLLLSRTTETAAAEAAQMMDQGLAQCGQGDVDMAKDTLRQAYEIADKGVTEKFGQDATGQVAAAPEKAPEKAPAEEKPWWRFW